jgi:uncharacterized protein (DUF4415 family)
MNKSGRAISGNTISILEQLLSCLMAALRLPLFREYPKKFGLLRSAKSTLNLWLWFGHGGRIIAALFHSGEREMAKKENIVSYTLEEIQAVLAAGGDQSNWEKAAAKTYEEIEADIASEPDEAGMIVDWSKATTVMPEPKAVLNMRVDRDVLHYFKHQGKGYQSRINAVLRTYVEHQKGR